MYVKYGKYVTWSWRHANHISNTLHICQLTGASCCQEPPFEDWGIWGMCQECAEHQSTSTKTPPTWSNRYSFAETQWDNVQWHSDRISSLKYGIDSASLMFRFTLSSACFMLFVQGLVGEFWVNCRRSWPNTCPILPNQSQLYLF